MCGIFGLTINKKKDLVQKDSITIFRELFLLSESRGKEASGFAMNDGHEIKVFKAPVPASELVRTLDFRSAISKLFLESNEYSAAIGHSRLVTNGYEQFNKNNQPIVKSDMAGIHNGIIVNESELWTKYKDEQKLSDLDSELIPTLLRRSYKSTGNLSHAVKSLYEQIYGMTSIAFLFNDLRNLLLATNNGSLYFLTSIDRNAFIFASEKHILQLLLNKKNLKKIFNSADIVQLKAMQMALLDVANTKFEIKAIDNNFSASDFSLIFNYKNALTIKDISHGESNKNIFINTSLNHDNLLVPDSFAEHIYRCTEKIDKLKRCTKCLLPETFPMIKYDNNGICNYCLNYKKLTFQGEEKLRKILDCSRSMDDSPDCLMPFSGGRDSSYTLHYVKKVLKMNPIAFSYDWGMITDLARRNQSRLCGKLGIEHILISADIRKKREYIRKNVLAWLKRPNLGTIPLFMAGDKQYFYYANKISKSYNLKLILMGENRLEKTGFKTAFSGAKQSEKGFMAYHVNTKNKLRMALFYFKEVIANPSYLNSSLKDTFGAFLSYYILPHDYLNFYDYLKWDESIISKTLIADYDWETDPETKTTWRIGDGTAAFYNYIYYMVAGFTENDTFRSNQIREGDLTREEALELSKIENQARWDSIQWYCSTIGIDFINCIQTINNIKSLY